ncbi:Bug family tripartite tricarboxylate transporter substrate binding protein [Marinivivus vitaminiproducens]|uniref:Bug family tripartite tricarboxylate transporter substrate binding protein n=1 Tax=Marinivivus vitaminiproducens TaxID=3035935 RepID=UPI0027A862D4|nr:tripartite tricarboxylate transporter substrate-binding protein [Geminicoccaceae bacterium SCSIO 64248]
MISRRSILRLSLAAGAALSILSMNAGGAMAQAGKLDIIAPAAPGGGWDQVARAMQAVLQDGGLASPVQVQNIPGAGGTIGLAQFVSSKARSGDTVMVAGLVMEGAILANESPVSFDDIKPLARLIGEYEVVVAPTDSDIKSVDDLVAKLKADPGSVSWGGGSAGGTDHMLAGLVAKAVGVDPSGVNYIAHSGGGEAMASILGGHVSVGVSGYQEFAAQIESGELRAIAISSDERVEGLDIPTFKEQGVDVSLTNWRGLLAPARIDDDDFETLSALVAQMVETPAWQEVLSSRGWLAMYQPAEEFTAFLEEDQAQTEAILKDIGLIAD